MRAYYVPGTVLSGLPALSFSSLPMRYGEGRGIIVPTLEIKKLKWGEMKQLAQNITARKWRSWAWNGGLLGPEPYLFHSPLFLPPGLYMETSK